MVFFHAFKVRNYHASFYRPENLCIIVTGQIEAESVLLQISEFEDRIVSKVLFFIPEKSDFKVNNFDLHNFFISQQFISKVYVLLFCLLCSFFVVLYLS